MNIISDLEKLSFKYISDEKKPECISACDKLIGKFNDKSNQLDQITKAIKIENLFNDEHLQGCLNELDSNEQSKVIAIKNEVLGLLEEKNKLEILNEMIFCEPGAIDVCVEAAERLLIEKECGIYQRSGKLVRAATIPTVSSKRDSIKRSSNAIVIDSVDQISLTWILASKGKFGRFNRKENEIKTIDCPERIARYILSKSEWDLPILSGIINAPTLRSDGSILEQPGYDKETGLLYIPDGTQFNSIPKNPSKLDAEKALKGLMDLLDGFPFEGKENNNENISVALSAILTALIRRSIATAPLHGFTAPKMSSGKSLLADTAALIATGKPNSVITYTNDTTEEKKRILSVLMAGDPIVCYDNIEVPFGSAALSSILTQRSYKDRELGKNKNIEVPTSTFFMATGNNLTFIGDFSTRAILCKLDPQMERPEERSFETNLYDYIPEHRAELVVNALTILRAFYVAGMPKKETMKEFGRFEEWSSSVRAALIWLDMTDPCASRKEIENADPVRASLGNLLTTWYAFYGPTDKRVKDVVKETATLPTDDNDEMKEKMENLRDALIDMAPDGKGGINEAALSRKISSFKGRIENGYCFEKDGESGGIARWMVKKL